MTLVSTHDSTPSPLPRARPITWTIPGTGPIRKESCGKAVYRDGKAVARRCPVHLESRTATRVCRTPGCGNWDCVLSWARREGIVGERQFNAMETALRDAGYRVGTGPRHWIISPPQRGAAGALLDEEAFNRLRKDAARRALDAGLHGFSMVWHPFRHEGCRFRGGPHFHLLAYGYALDTEAFVARNEDWILKNKGARISIARTIAYFLDHCGLLQIAGVTQRRDRIYWYGTMSTRLRRKVGMVKTKVALRCRALAPSGQTRLTDGMSECGAKLEDFYLGTDQVIGIAYEVLKLPIYVADVRSKWAQQTLDAG